MIAEIEINKNVDKVFSGPEGSLNTLLGVATRLFLVREKHAGKRSGQRN